MQCQNEGQIIATPIIKFIIKKKKNCNNLTQLSKFNMVICNICNGEFMLILKFENYIAVYSMKRSKISFFFVFALLSNFYTKLVVGLSTFRKFQV